MTRDHHDMVLRAFWKPIGENLAIEGNIVALLEGLIARALDISNLLMVGDSGKVISGVYSLERDPWKYDMWLHQILNLASHLGCSFS